VILSTHNLDEAERVADRVGVLRRRFLAIASPADLRRRVFGSNVTVALGVEAGPFAAAAAGAGARDVNVSGKTLSFGLQDVEAETPAVVRALVEAGAPIVSVTPADQPLEDVYFALVGDEGAGQREAGA